MILLFRSLVLLLTLMLGFSAFSTAPAFAQSQLSNGVVTPDYAAWQRTAARADEAIESSRASTNALETLRAELVQWRQQFMDAQSANATAIETVQRQLDALGPPPEEGAEEPSETAAERALLNERLSRLREPVRAAELAFNRADGLIQGIDHIVRERQAKEIMQFGPSPLNPANWPSGLAALSQTAGHISNEVVASWRNPVQQEEARDALPVVLVLLVIGLILVFRGRRWSRLLTKRILGEDPGAARWLGGFVMSSGSLFLPFFGVYFIIEALMTTGLIGLRGGQKLEALGPYVFVFLLARWLATRIFPADEARTLPLSLSPEKRRAGRWYGAMLGLLVAASHFLQDVSNISGWSDNASVVVLYPLLLIAAYITYLIAGLLRAHVRADAEDDGEETYRSRMTAILALLLVAVSVVAPLLGAIGYFRLAQAIMYPALGSLEVLAVLLVLQRLVVEVYVLITGNRERASESLTPVLVGFLMVIASLPVFALIWGARYTDLTELMTKVAEGFNIGGTRISPAVFLTFAIVFVLGYTATRLVQGTLKNTILPKTKIDTGGRNAIVSGVGYLGIFLAAVVAITSAGIDLSSIAIVAGALSVGIGFGLQTIVSNFVSGIILLIERPISEGDWIEVGGVHGTVRDISVRSTIIQTFDRSDVIVPNSDLVSGRVTNYTRGNTVGRVIVPVGVAYGVDTKKVSAILQEIAEAHPLVLMNPPPFVVFRTFGASSLDFEIRAILRDVNYVLSVHSEMNHEIARRFEEEGIEIPFAQRDIWIRNPEALTGNASPDTPSPVTKTESAAAHMTADDMDGSGDADAAGDGDGR